MKLDLLSLVSHELRTPLTSVLAALQMLREEELSQQKMREILEIASRNAERLNSVLNQLLDLSNLVNGRFVCQFHEINTAALLKPQVQRLQENASKAEISLDLEVHEDLPAILGDAVRLEHVLAAIFDNAVKFCPSKGKIKLSVQDENRSKQESSIVLSLANTIDTLVVPDMQSLVQVFSQSEGLLDRLHEGVGGSLAIAYEVIQQHGGQLKIGLSGLKEFKVEIYLPRLESDQALLKVISSRVYRLRRELGAVSLVILKVDSRDAESWFQKLQASLFRASDSVYALSGSRLALVLDDCKKADAPKLLKRLISNMKSEGSSLSLQTVTVGLANCPEDTIDPDELVKKASQGLSALQGWIKLK